LFDSINDVRIAKVSATSFSCIDGRQHGNLDGLHSFGGDFGK
jgi:hypothetical protein